MRREFVKRSNWVQWNRGENAIIVMEDTIKPCEPFHGCDEATREEFIAAAMQAIEKMREAGIDIGTDWLPKWEPKEGEVCCFWERGDVYYLIGIYTGRGGDRYPYRMGDVYDYEHCAPFDGTIPEPFKSRWEAEKP